MTVTLLFVVSLTYQSAVLPDEKQAKGLQKAIDSMGGTWRKRKRSCMEFLMNMEDATDGKVDVKKCLKGDGVVGPLLICVICVCRTSNSPHLLFSASPVSFTD